MTLHPYSQNGTQTSMELRKETREWEKVSQNFIYTFQFTDEKKIVDIALKAIKEKIFVEIPLEVSLHFTFPPVL